MIQLKTRPLLAGALLLGAFFISLAVGPCAEAQSSGYATQVLDYTVGTGSSSSLTNPNAALGQPGGSANGATLNPFDPNYTAGELTGIGMGGQLTLGLSNFVTVGAAGTDEIGFYGNVGLVNTGTTGNPAAGNPATVFGLRSVLISVSADGVNFVPVNGGALITSTLPTNYYTNADTTNVNAPPPANPTLADFGKPFIGSLASFNGETYAQTLTTLNGSAGGTWLDLSATGLSKVGYVRFNEPASGGANGGVFYLNGVSSNEALLGTAAPTVPEPGSLTCGVALVMVALMMNRGKRIVRAALVVACVLAGIGGGLKTASAQMLGFSDIQNWTGTGTNEAAMVIDWHDGKTPISLVWGYRFNGTATGLDMINAIDAADPRLDVFYAYGGSYVYGIGYDLNNNGGMFTPGSPGVDANGNSTETGFASDPGDHYAEGAFTKFWGYDTSEGSPYGGGGTWTEAQTGPDGRDLLNDSWDAYSLSYDETNFTIPYPDLPTPADANVPEPSAWLILALGGLVAGVVVRQRREQTA